MDCPRRIRLIRRSGRGQFRGLSFQAHFRQPRKIETCVAESSRGSTVPYRHCSMNGYHSEVYQILRKESRRRNGRCGGGGRRGDRVVDRP